MTVRHFRWISPIAIALELSVSLFTATLLGYSAEWTSEGYRFAGGSAPWALGLAALISFLYLLLMDAKPVAAGAPVASLLRRFIAFWVDFLVGMSAISPVVGLLPIIVEWKRTGVFAWSFERTTPAPSDIPVTVCSAMLAGIVLLLYYAIPLVRLRPSPGACVLGYQVLPEAGGYLTLRRALARTSLGFVAVCGACIAPFVGRKRKKGMFWLDNMFRTRAVWLK